MLEKICICFSPDINFQLSLFKKWLQIINYVLQKGILMYAFS